MFGHSFSRRNPTSLFQGTLYSWFATVSSAIFSSKSDLHIGLLRVGKNRPIGYPVRADEIENNPCLLPFDSILASATRVNPCREIVHSV